jgi:hypothetical protein
MLASNSSLLNLLVRDISRAKESEMRRIGRLARPYEKIAIEDGNMFLGFSDNI